MKMLASVVTILFALGSVAAQDGAAPKSPTPAPIISGVPILARASAEAPVAIVEKFHAKIRDVQVDQAKWKEQLLNLKLQQAEAEKRIAEYDETIKKIAYEAALEQKVDVTQYDLDIGTMHWIRRAQQADKGKKP